MNEYYIYRDEGGYPFKLSDYDENGKYNFIVIRAKTPEEAEEKYFQQNNIPEEDKWLFYARDKEVADEEERFFKENGYESWDDYYDDMYPERPIEL